MTAPLSGERATTPTTALTQEQAALEDWRAAFKIANEMFAIVERDLLASEARVASLTAAIREYVEAHDEYPHSAVTCGAFDALRTSLTGATNG